jgi:hypothetical protein
MKNLSPVESSRGCYVFLRIYSVFQTPREQSLGAYRAVLDCALGPVHVHLRSRLPCSEVPHGCRLLIYGHAGAVCVTSTACMYVRGGESRLPWALDLWMLHRMRHTRNRTLSMHADDSYKQPSNACTLLASACSLPSALPLRTAPSAAQRPPSRCHLQDSRAPPKGAAPNSASQKRDAQTLPLCKCLLCLCVCIYVRACVLVILIQEHRLVRKHGMEP